MIFRILLLCFTAIWFSGCSGISNPLDSNHPVVKLEVKEATNTAIQKKNALHDILSRPTPAEELSRNMSAIQLDDRRLMRAAIARQAVMLERAKNAIVVGHVDEAEMFYMWNLLVDSYVETKTIANRYTAFFSPSKMASFVLLEDKVSAKGKEIETEMLNLSDDNSNKTFNLIMEQSKLMNEMFILVVSK